MVLISIHLYVYVRVFLFSVASDCRVHMFFLAWWPSVKRHRTVLGQTRPKEQKEIPEPAMQVEDMPSVQPVLGLNSRFSGSKGSQLRMWFIQQWNIVTSATGKSRNHGLTHGYYIYIYILVMFLVLGWFSSVWRIAAGVSLIIERVR